MSRIEDFYFDDDESAFVFGNEENGMRISEDDIIFVQNGQRIYWRYIMYICLDCGELFEEPRKYTETHGFDSPPYEERYGCPECGGTYTETRCCDNCGRWICGEYIRLDGGYYYCDNCYEVYDIGD